MVSFRHCGLYFGADQVQHARQKRAVEPFRSAWAFLLEQEQGSALSAAIWNGLRYRLNDDQAAGEQTVLWLQSGLGLDDDDDSASYFDALTVAVASAQVVELVRDHPAFSLAALTQWLNRFAVRVNRLNQTPYSVTHFEQLWLGALDVAAGIVLERDDLFERGASMYRQTINDDIRPEGYIPRAVEAGDGQGLYRQLLSVKALALMAEAAAQVGVDLWGYASRGVTIATAAAYLIFYYYYPDKWRWDAGGVLEIRRFFRQHGGFLEMVNYRTQLRDVRLVLDDLRPIYDYSGGGLTTLTHAPAGPKRRLFV